MGDKLSIYVEIVLLDCRAQRWHINRYVDDAKEGQGEHGRYTASQRRKIDEPEF